MPHNKKKKSNVQKYINPDHLRESVLKEYVHSVHKSRMLQRGSWAERACDNDSDLFPLVTIRMCVFLNGSLILFLHLQYSISTLLKIMFYSTFYDQEIKVIPTLCVVFLN
jgi:hypothetical protein